MTLQQHALVPRLRAELSDGAVLTDPDVLATRRQDMARFCPAGYPAVLVRPASTAEVQQVVRTAVDTGTPVVPQGARTGLSGAANAVDGCILLSTERMNRIVEIDEHEQIAVVQPGVVNADLARAALARGLFYPPDPSSWESSTIGGNVATNAGGLACVKYGVTADFVRGMEVVLGTGEVIRTGRRTAKGVAGYDLTHLLVGSEGTLGVVTEITLALRSAPEPALTAAATFRTCDEAFRAAAAVMAAGLRPSLLEFIDGTTARSIQEYRDMGLPADVGGLLLAQSDRGPRAAQDVAAIGAICKANGAVDVAVASDADEADLLLEARRLVHLGLERLGTTLIDDVAVPRRRLPDLLHGIEAISQEYGVVVACPGHVGDGNMHPTVVFEAGDPDAEARAVRAFEAIMELGLALGGTITGEHGVGVLKRNWLATELGPTALQVQAGIKRLFDPYGVLNPGKVFSPDTDVVETKLRDHAR